MTRPVRRAVRRLRALVREASAPRPRRDRWIGGVKALKRLLLEHEDERARATARLWLILVTVVAPRAEVREMARAALSVDMYRIALELTPRLLRIVRARKGGC